MPRIRPVREEVLRDRLDHLVATFDISTITPDPLELVLRYREPLDQEVAGLLAAAFAYGRADIVVANIGKVLDAMKPSPFAYLSSFDAEEAPVRFAGFTHRFQKAPELVELLTRLAAVIREHGSLGALFRKCHDERDDDIGPALTRFVAAVVNEGQSPVILNRRSAVKDLKMREPRILRSFGVSAPQDDKRGHSAALRYLLTSPADGSACKRMNLYLRWMVRRTSPDLGLWRFVDPAKLVVPLDTHVHRIATFLGLSTRRTPDWKAARALTDRLARFDAADPVRYDFAICRLGILDLCSRTRRKENCDVCLLRDACRFPIT